mmetsp:Transcript_122607/g.358066  ORF Transcript_122607/g.358066 Transcript_122607/m.358066 type:complete len:348 (-) Transcript_122607:252-1295(-)
MCRRDWACVPATACLLAAFCRGAQALRLHSSSDMETANYDFSKVVKHAGLYMNKHAHPEFSNTVLVTAGNIAYSDMLRNWRCHADKLGLDYVIIALDPDIYNAADRDRSLLIDGGKYFRGAARFRQGHFNEMSCSKVRIVLDILIHTGLNVVFSDPDNVFRHDPFARGVSLGDKMRLGTFQYIYQQNHGKRNPPNESDIGSEVEEGNTGFYFVSGSSKRKGVQSLFRAALAECSQHKNIDDQTNFWKALKTVRRGLARSAFGADSFACASLCGRGSPACGQEGGEGVFDYCEMDPWNHATGWEVAGWKGPQKIVTYHANFIGGNLTNKMGKLRRNGFWDTGCVGVEY